VGEIGEDNLGWRDDWALVCLKNEWKAANGSWWQDEMMDTYFYHLKATAESPQLEATAEQKFTGSAGITGTVDAKAGTVYKDGASTGCTAGKVGETECHMWLKGTAEGAPEADDAMIGGKVDRAKIILVHPTNGQSNFTLPGDSGCGVFSPDLDNNGWNWVGQIVSNLNLEDGRSLSLMVPQSAILRSLETFTGKGWHLFKAD
jgi:hypothetical protein